jgi:hypothetical protein
LRRRDAPFQFEPARIFAAGKINRTAGALEIDPVFGRVHKRLLKCWKRDGNRRVRKYTDKFKPVCAARGKNELMQQHDECEVLVFWNLDRLFYTIAREFELENLRLSGEWIAKRSKIRRYRHIAIRTSRSDFSSHINPVVLVSKLRFFDHDFVGCAVGTVNWQPPDHAKLA